MITEEWGCLLWTVLLLVLGYGFDPVKPQARKGEYAWICFTSPYVILKELYDPVWIIQKSPIPDWGECFEIEYLINMLNNIRAGSWQTSQDTNRTIFALDTYGWVRIRKYWMRNIVFVNTIGSWRMSQGSAKIGWRILYLWILSYNLCKSNWILTDESGFQKRSDSE